MNKALEELGRHIEEACAHAVTGVDLRGDELTVHAHAEQIAKLLSFLRDDGECLFKVLVDITAVDWPQREQRFDVVYHLLSMHLNQRVRVKLTLEEGGSVPSVTQVFATAGWFEREIWDMFGIFVTDHPDLRRILSDYGFQGHPLRKDFPLTGFVELRYDEEQKRVVYEPVKLTQEFRNFDFLSPWEGAKYILPGDEKAGAAKEGE